MVTTAEQEWTYLQKQWLLGNLSLAPVVTASVVTGASTGTAVTTADQTVDATAGGVTVLAANASRKSAIIENTGSANIRVRVDGNPAAATGIQLAPGATLILDQPFVPITAVKAIREGGTNSTVSVVEVS